MSTNAPLGALHEPLTGRHLDARACRGEIARRADFLRRLGLQRGDRVFLHHGHSAQFFIDLAAVWNAGGTAVPLDARLSPFEIDQLAGVARPRFCLFEAEPSAAVADVLERYGTQLVGPGMPVGLSTELQPGAAAPDDDALILFTSGTTGEPKGVVHTHRSLQVRWRHQLSHLGSAPLQRTLCLLPTNFAWGLAGNALFVWMTGHDLFVLPPYRSDVLLQLARLCDEHEITYLPTVPSMWRTVLRMVAPPVKGSLRRVACGTSPLSAALWRDVRNWARTDDVINVYSMTECGVIACHSSATAEPEDGLVGTPFTGTTVRIVPPDTPRPDVLHVEECAPETPGQIWVRSDCLMRGYYQRNDLTSEVVVDEWFCTGDLGARDTHGRIRLVGREKDMINAGGVKIYPGDVDKVIERAAPVLDCCTFAASDPLHGEQVAVAVVLKSGNAAELAEVHRWARERLASFQVPRVWYLLDAIPRTARGKLNRARVAQVCANRKPVDARLLHGRTGQGAGP